MSWFGHSEVILKIAFYVPVADLQENNFTHLSNQYRHVGQSNHVERRELWYSRSPLWRRYGSWVSKLIQKRILFKNKKIITSHTKENEDMFPSRRDKIHFIISDERFRAIYCNSSSLSLLLTTSPSSNQWVPRSTLFLFLSLGYILHQMLHRRDVSALTILVEASKDYEYFSLS